MAKAKPPKSVPHGRGFDTFPRTPEQIKLRDENWKAFETKAKKKKAKKKVNKKK